jgi:hypothetical protein
MKLEGSPNGLSLDATTAPRGNLVEKYEKFKLIAPDLAPDMQCP